MRRLILTGVASVAFLAALNSAAAVSHAQSADQGTNTVVVTAGQGGSISIPIPSTPDSSTPGEQVVWVSAGQGGMVPFFEPTGEPAEPSTPAMASVEGL